MHTEIRALAERNVFLITTPLSAKLQATTSEELPPASYTKSPDIQQLHQVIPGDLDWPGMSFAVVLASHDDRKAVAIVTVSSPRTPSDGDRTGRLNPTVLFGRAHFAPRIAVGAVLVAQWDRIR